MKKILLLLFAFSINVLFVAADSCEEQLNKAQADADKVKVSYEILKETKKVNEYSESAGEYLDLTTDVTIRTVRTNVFNITENLIIRRTERLRYKDGIKYDTSNLPLGTKVNYDEFGKEFYINYKDTKNGTYSFDDELVSYYRDYIFDIYPKIDSSCEVRKLRSIEYRKPRFNKYSESDICKDYPTVELCSEFIMYDFELNGNDFTEEVLKRVRNSGSKVVTKKVKPDGSEYTFLEENWLYLTIGAGVVIAGVAAYVIISKKRSRI